MPVPKCCQQNAFSVSLPEYILGAWDKGTIWAPLSYNQGDSAFPSSVSFSLLSVQTHPSLTWSNNPYVRQNTLEKEGTSFILQRIGIKWQSNHMGGSQKGVASQNHFHLTPESWQTSWRYIAQMCSMWIPSLPPISISLYTPQGLFENVWEAFGIVTIIGYTTSNSWKGYNGSKVPAMRGIVIHKEDLSRPDCPQFPN